MANETTGKPEVTAANVPSFSIPQSGWLPMEEKKLIAFGASHLFLMVLCFLSILAAVYFYDSKRAAVADLRAVQAEAKAQTADQQNKILQQQTAQQIADLAAENKNLQLQVASLASAISRRDATAQVQVQSIRELPPTTLAVQWGAAASEPAPVVSPQGDFLVPLPLAQKSYGALYLVPVLQADKQDLTAELDKERQVIVNDAQALSSEQKAHQVDNNTCGVDKGALNATISKVKADARKSKFRWTVGGFLAGALTVAAHFL